VLKVAHERSGISKTKNAEIEKEKKKLEEEE